MKSSALQRAEIAEMYIAYLTTRASNSSFSALQRAEIAEIQRNREPRRSGIGGFSALQRAEIAEMFAYFTWAQVSALRFSALQRAEIAEIPRRRLPPRRLIHRFSALQRAEIAEMHITNPDRACENVVSVLFNEPKLLKWYARGINNAKSSGFSALQRAEIAEIMLIALPFGALSVFQCSSTSRNC